MNPDAERFNFFTQHRRAVVVELYRHQVGGEFHHVGFKPQLFEGVGRLQPEQATANDYAASGSLRMRGNVIEIVQRTVDKAARQRVARHRRHKRIRAGRQHQFVPVDFVTAGGTHHVRVAIDGDNLLRQTQLYAVSGKEIALHQREGLRAAAAKIL